jgi:hypothetical protein
MMNRLCTLTIAALLLLSFVGCAAGDQAPPTSPASDAVIVSFDYAKQSGHASNQFAVWIEDVDGHYIQTLYATRFTANGGYANRPDSIPAWVAKSDLPSMTRAEADAITGATPKSGTLSYIWDLTDKNGDAVAPGAYQFFVEGSLRWKNRVVYSGVIEVGGAAADAEASVEFIYEASADQSALDDAAPENAMIGPVTAAFIPAGDR